MARFILWVILFIIVVRIVWRFVYAVLEGAGMAGGPPAPAAVKLVRDPVCGVYVVPSNALTAGSGAATKYFCSEKCRSAWGKR